jgi:hypothetical protein
LASNFPSSIDSITNPNSTDSLSSPSHSEQHIIANTAIEALETKVGIDNSTDQNSLDYKVTDAQAQITALAASVQTLGGNTVEVLGLQGNNDLEVYGIENPTTIDTIDSSVWQSAEYKMQVTKGNDVYSSDINVLFTPSVVNVSEFNIISSSDGFHNPAHFDFVYNGSIIDLVITPVSGSVSVRFYRTALKK